MLRLHFELPHLGRSPEGLPRVNTSGLFPDPWQMSVYLTEFVTVPVGAALTRSGAQALADATCDRFGRPRLPIESVAIPVPAFEFDHRDGRGLRLLFPEDGCLGSFANEHIVLHEISHHLAVSIFQREAHGPLFVGCFLEAAAAHFGADTEPWHWAFREAGLPALSTEQVRALRAQTALAPLDVEAMQTTIAGLPGVPSEIAAYYAGMPSSQELAERVERLYAENGVAGAN